MVNGADVALRSLDLVDGAIPAGVLEALPGRTQGRWGRAGDPLNLLFLGREDAVRAALAEAGWTAVPLGLLESVALGAADLARGGPLARFPPFDIYRIEGRPQDMNWAIPVRGISARHHFRLWRRPWRDPRGRVLWCGSANYDLRVRWRDLSHVPDPNADAERDFIGRTLEGSARVERRALAPLPQVPRSGTNDKGYPFTSDGRVLIVTLVP